MSGKIPPAKRKVTTLSLAGKLKKLFKSKPFEVIKSVISCITVFFVILTFINSKRVSEKQIEIAKIQNEMTNRQNDINNLSFPLTFEVYKDDENTTEYSINGEKTGIKNSKTMLKITSGSCQQFSMISFNGENPIVMSLEMPAIASVGYTYAIDSGDLDEKMMLMSILEENVFYDYNFVYAVSSEGEKILLLIYDRIDLNEKTISGPILINSPFLLMKDSVKNTSIKTMYENYWELFNMLNELPVLT